MKLKLQASETSRILARAYYTLNELDKAQTLYQALLKKDPANLLCNAELGVIFARQGNRAQAEMIIQKLETLKEPYGYGAVPYAQGRIAANLGDRGRALKLLSQSLDEGRQFRGSVSFNQDPDLLMLKDDPEYQKLLRRM